jgi:signal transduction histidine kinase
MKIRQRLTLQFVGIVALLFGFVLGAVYYINQINAESDFYKKIEERAYVAAYKFLEEDEVSKDRIEIFEKRYLQSLSNEIIQVLDDSNAYAFIEKDNSLSFTRELLEHIRRDSTVQYREKERQFVGIYYRDNQGNFVILASAVDIPGEAKLDSLRTVLILSFACSLLFIFIGGRFFAERALAPMNAIVRRVRTITASNLHLRIQTNNDKDEIGELALTFNDMLKRLEHSFELQRTFVSNASHELRTPITAIIGEIEVQLTKKRTIEEYKESLQNVLDEAEQLKELLNMLLSLAQTFLLEKNELIEEIRIDELLWEMREDALKTNPKSRIRIDLHVLPENPEALLIHANKFLLASAFRNLLDNAVKFSTNQPVDCRLTTERKMVHITIADQGIGISEGDIQNLFQPFFRAQNARSFFGHGIGLALADKIVRVHGGNIAVSSKLGEGTVFTVTLPTVNSIAGS